MKVGRKPHVFGRNFWERVEMGDKSSKACWLWKGSYVKKGHGQVTYEGKAYPAHRVAFELCHGRAPEGVVRHTCNTYGCCNPFHLVEGTQADNMRDRLGTSTDHSSADEECRGILRDLLDAGVSIGKVSRTFGIKHESVVKIRDRVGLYAEDA